MYDQDTADLIRATPSLVGLDREALPDLLTETFAQIAAARIRLREPNAEELDELVALVGTIRRLAFTNEALVSILPEREDRSAAAFVAATAHQLCLNADRLFSSDHQQTFIDSRAISSDLAAMLLFIVAEATADAGEVSKVLNWKTDDPIENSLILALRDLACGRLVLLTGRAIPDRETVASAEPALCATRALYRAILEGVHVLANLILLGDAADDPRDPVQVFRRVCQLSIGSKQHVSDEWEDSPTSAFSGPHHLASLLVAVSKDLSDSAVTRISAPPNVDPVKWGGSMQRLAKSRPFLWRNHREAIDQGYLQRGTSAAVGFPTGAGKSTLAELKINTALLAEKTVIFLAPTHALVDQTTRSLASSFPTASVQRERQDEFGIVTGDEELPEILVMTPEACLTQMSIDASVFEDVGLFVFDECHLLHASDKPNDRRAVDAMLCVLNLANIAGEADFLLLSAMMKNTDDIAGWIADLTDRPCLSLALSWKPTRQLRGSVVYQQNTVTALQKRLTFARQTRKTKFPPDALKRMLDVTPMALFSMKQTWATNKRTDYALLGLLDEPVQLAASKYWKLTPNAVKVSSAISAAAVETNLKTLVFFQTIKNAASAANEISNLLEPVSIKLRDDEAGWLEIATLEMGAAAHLYLEVDMGKVVKPATVHHGLLLPEERHLCESLYKRANGIKVLTATSTLAQGMNLPSELVIIGEDSRFDQAKDKREILEAQELLNAAGRAGRAGENASGIVLVVPGKVVGIDVDASTIGAHWTDLRAIFGQSDQCLEIDDPLTAVLDRVHAGTDHTGEIERYAIVRLVSGAKGDTETEALSSAIKSSFGAYLAKKRQDDDWLQSRVDTAIAFFKGQSPESKRELVETQVAASLGLSLELVSRLSAALEENGPGADAKVPEWRRWFFRWLSENPELLEQVCRRQSLIELFGKKRYEALRTDDERAAFALPILSKLIWRWMRGDPLSELEMALGTDPKKLKTCDKARRFALRIIPELSYLFGLPALLHERGQVNAENPIPLSAVLSQLGRCVRLGFNFHEKAALHQIMRKARFSRRQLHQHYALIKPYLAGAASSETWEQTIARVELASDKELNARGLD
uniref:DEAD/DEAH box helicase n=1 Tax=Pararhizobium sp. IMCC3301 TaxID=3067904 RepID=UPI002741BC12|nr:DEAD/DEAH box helicase [Pararhizobium sp. IMCC3301]